MEQYAPLLLRVVAAAVMKADSPSRRRPHSSRRPSSALGSSANVPSRHAMLRAPSAELHCVSIQTLRPACKTLISLPGQLAQ